MCTIITADREKFAASEAAFIARIRADARHNSDGFALMTVGASQDKTQLIRSMDVESVIDILKMKNFQRFWFHARMATGLYKGIDGCHGFISSHDNKEWFVFHNGVFRHTQSSKFRVDSMWLASLVNQYGPDGALGIIRNNEGYANVFLVSPAAERWYTLRQTGGTLYQDGEGTYSTNKIEEVAEQSVKDHFWQYQEFKCPKYAWRSPHSTYPLPGETTGGTTNTESRTELLPAGVEDGDLSKDWKQYKGLWRRKLNDVVYVSIRRPSIK